MVTRKVSKLWFMALLLVVFTVGCGEERGFLSPTLTSINPNRGTQGQTVPVTLTGANFTVGASVNVGGALITVSNTTVVSSTQITATFAIATAAVLGPVSISVTSSGMTTNTVTYTIGPPLTVTSTIPANGAANVPINQVLTATLSQAVNCATVTTSNFTLTGPAGAVAGTVTCSGATATFTPTSHLASNGFYTATLTTGIQDPVGDPLLTNDVWSFTTALLPTVISTNPTNGATGVLVNQVLTATFSQAVNCATITTSSFTLTGPAGAVAGTVACSGTGATFTPTSNLAPNAAYTATITTGATNLAGAALASNYVWSFTTSANPSVISTIPTNGATAVPIGQAPTATFSQVMNCATITTSSFTLTGPAGAVTGTVACSGPSATFTPGSPLASNTTYTATLTTGVTNVAGAPLASIFVWSFTTAPPPSVTSTVPLNSATGVPINIAITATFSEFMNPATLTSTTFTLTGPGGPVAGTVAAPNGITAAFTPAANLAPNALYVATITTGAQNTVGIGLANNYVWGFRTGPGPIIPPTVISTNPANNATAVPVNQAIAATFNEAMDPATITPATFTLTGPGGVAVTGTVTFVVAGSIATFAPNAALAPLTTYVATITTGAKDLAENPLASNYAWTFTTGVVPDTTPPTVISTIPASGAVGVPINQAVSATFSKPMNPATINSTTFNLVGPGGTAVTGLVTYAAIANTATFTPTANLAPNTLYTAIVTTGATDLAGNPLAAGIVPNPWSFTTAVTLDTTDPTLISTNPINASSNVPVNTTVSATFSKPMDALTITSATFDLAGPGGVVITGTIAYDPVAHVATLTPASELATNTTYVATITTGATDLSGNPLGPGIVSNPWSFTTAPAVPLPPSPPTVSSTNPTNGGTGVPVNQVLTATFNQAMNCSTLTTLTFTLSGGVAGIVTCSGASATFTPGSLLAANTTYTATITTGSASGAGAALASNYVWTFTTAPAPTVTSTDPTNGATGVPVNQLLTATFSEPMNCATLTTSTFTLSGGETGTVGCVGKSATSATFTPTSLLATNTAYTATITTGAANVGGTALASNFVWSFTTSANPTVVSTVPTNGATGVPVNQVLTATFSAAVKCSTITSSTFSLAGPGGAVTGTVACLGSSATSVTLTPTSLLATNAVYTATLTTGITTPSANALVSNYVWSFTTAVAPVVTSTIPANGATGVPINQVVSATFNQAMTCATVATSFTLAGPGGNVSGTVGCLGTSATSATFTPTSLLAANAAYTATITTGAMNVAGAPLATNYAWSFTTAPAPTVTSTNPTNLATGVPVNQVLTATFSEPMNCATITTSSFTLTGPGGAAVGIVACSSTSATFTPTSLLAANSIYTATITTGATNVGGTPLATNFVWTFTTSANPTVVSTIPTNGATGVPVNQVLTATFSAAVNCSTVTSSTFSLAGPGGAVTGTVACLGTSATSVTLTPTSLLASNAGYTATLTTGIMTPQGQALLSNYVWSFTTAAAPTVTSTIPANGATGVPVNQVLTAIFSQAMSCATVTSSTLSLTGPGGPVTGTVACVGTSATSATFTPTSLLASNTTYTATITTGATNVGGTALASNFVWSFTTSANPTVVSTIPTNGATGVPVNQVLTATFSAAVNCTTVTSSSFSLSGPGGAVAGTVACLGASSTSVTLTPTNPLASNAGYTATLTTAIMAPLGQALLSNYVWSFTTAAAPTVTSTIPTNGATGVPINQVLTATFSQAMSCATVTSSTFSLTGPGGAVAGTVSCVGTSATSATLTPTSLLAANATYTATITTGAANVGGAPLATNYVWTFTTALAPAVTATNPTNLATGVPVNQVVTATFSEPMKCSTITTSFTLAGPGGKVLGAVGCAGASATSATFTPTSVLATNTAYTATITTVATNVGGTALAGNFVWSFTTSANPTVVSTIPANGATGVPVNQVLTATFSAAVNCTTVTSSTFSLTGPGGPVAGTVVCLGSSATNVTFTPTSLLASNAIYTATLTTGIMTPQGQALLSNYPWSFTTAAAPAVTSTIPINGATGVPINQVLSATFNQAMSCATVATSLTLSGPGGNVSGTVGCLGASATSATFTPASLLASDAIYTATMTTGATNVAGAALVSNFVWSFTTAPAPTVTSTNPTNGASGVPVNQVLTATFSEAMSCSTVTTSFTLAGPGGNVSGAVGCLGTSATSATFTPTSLLAANATLTATITTGARNVGGAALASNFVWSFTTSANPTVVSTVPTNGATGVPVNQALTATFSAAVNCSTVTSSSFSLSGPGGAVAGTVACLGASATSVTLTPTSLLASNAVYTATLTTGIATPQAQALLSNYVWSFTTAAAPAVTSTIPINGATGVPINQVLTATFNQAMSCATLATSFTLAGSGGNVSGTVGCLGTSATSATFTPTSLLASNAAYTATITTGAANVEGAPLATNYVWTFTTNLAPTVTSTNPTNLATGVPVNQVLTATFSEPMQCSSLTALTFTLTAPGPVSVPGLVACAGTSVTFTPTSLLTGSITYTATITTGATNVAGAPLASNYVWSFTTVGGLTVTLTIPPNGATGVPTNQALSAAFSQPVNCATITTSTFTLTGPGGLVGGTITSCAGSTATFTPSADLAINTIYTATLTTGVQEPGGTALAIPYVWTFKTGATPSTTPPTVTAVTPLNGATGVALNTAITAMFDEAMDPATMNGSTFTLASGCAPAARTPVAGTVVTYNPINNIITLTPGSNLAPLTCFTATVTIGAESLADVAMVAPFVWTFTTGAALDTTPPTVISTSPVNGATDVPLNQLITATFSKAMNDNTINTTTFTLFQGATPIPGTVSYIAGSDTAIFTPTSNLTADTVYTATITTGVSDLAGNFLVNADVWSFTTAAAPVITPPTVVSTNPASNATLVCPNAAINATFSMVMDPATINTATFYVTVGGVLVPGTISFTNGATGTIATFTPLNNLVTGSSYTVAITTDVTDLAGIPLANLDTWSFTVGPSCISPVNLGSLTNFVVVAGAGLSNVNAPGTTVLNGNVALYPTATITGNPTINGTLYVAPSTVAKQAEADLVIAYGDAVGLPAGTNEADLSSMTLAPGVYTSASTMMIAVNGSLTLDAQGNANAFWVFQVGTALTVGTGATVVLENGAKAANVFWAVGSSTTIGAGATFVGTVMSLQANTLDTGATVVGRIFCENAAITLQDNTITLPTP